METSGNKSRCSFLRCGICSLVFGVLLGGLALSVSLLLSIVVNGQLDDMFLLDATTRTSFSNWSTAVPVLGDTDSGNRYLQIYVFDILNPEAVLNGTETPLVEEKGPYVYVYGWERHNFTWSEDKDIVEYNQWKYYKFDESLSVGPEDTLFTTANIPFWGIVDTLIGPFSPSDKMNMAPSLYNCTFGNPLAGAGALRTCEQQCGSGMFCPLKPGPDCNGTCPTDVKPFDQAFVRKTVREFLFGYDDPQMAVANAFSWTSTPPFFPGIFENTSKAGAKRYAPKQAIRTGLVDKSEAYYHTMSNGFGPYIKACPPNKTSPFIASSPACVTPWENNASNRVGGSDGMLFPRGVTSATKLDLWLDPADRKITLVNKGGVKIHHKGIELLKFVPEATSYANSSENAENAGYDMFQGTGFFNLTKAQYGAPVFLSFPHFLHSDPSYVQAIDGLSTPKASVHGYDLGVEPMLGKVMYGAARHQVNVKMGPKRPYTGWTNPIPGTANITWFPSMKPVMMPTMWLVDGGNCSEAQAAQFKSSLGLVKPAQLGIQVVAGAIGALLLVLGLYCLYQNRRLGAAREHGYQYNKF